MFLEMMKGERDAQHHKWDQKPRKEIRCGVVTTIAIVGSCLMQSDENTGVGRILTIIFDAANIFNEESKVMDNEE